MNDHTAGQADEQNSDSDFNLDQEQSLGSAEMTLDEALSKLTEAEVLIAGHQTEVLRLHADAQNIRRRAEQDIEKAHKYGQERLLSELLPVIDNLERALQASGTDDNELLLALKQGVELTLKSFVDCLRKFNVEMLDPVGEPFDPLFHQAIAMVESKTAEPDSVLSVMQKGYSLNGRVLRPAMVVVARAPAASIDTRA
jgi:molecular chaperone GrpE